MKRFLLLLALGAVRIVLAFVAVAVMTATTVLLWRDARYVARTVNAWVDQRSR